MFKYMRKKIKQFFNVIKSIDVSLAQILDNYIGGKFLYDKLFTSLPEDEQRNVAEEFFESRPPFSEGEEFLDEQIARLRI